MGEFHDKKAAFALHSTESKVGVCIAARMSVVGGLGSELYLVGWTVCMRGIRKVLDDGLKDMVLLAGVRILTVLLGLTALKYIASPSHSELFADPIVSGLIFCSLSDSSFHVIGFIAALMSNCVDCIQNVLTKRLLNRSYSIIAVAMQLMFIVYNWMATPPDPALEANKTDRSMTFVFLVLVADGMCFYIQSALAYMLMSLVSPVTHSVANCVKRALIIVLSIYRYGEDVTPLNWCGMMLVIFGYTPSTPLRDSNGSRPLRARSSRLSSQLSSKPAQSAFVGDPN
ncbi:Sugar phosphate transporter domain [Phytophthora cactorum]|nr:Sugar phosphate transporter domain [Phytophthora cactorum]